ncbi:MAG: polysaccharide biosynthesis protein [Draconibacterium sp.]|nr:polysaccharide biosynthesis protein [Draconibacterium sp.]
MVNRIKIYFSKRYLPRWLVLLFDLFIVLLTFLLAYILRFNFNFKEIESSLDLIQMLVILPVFLFSFRLIRSYAGILRHSSTEEIARIVFALSIGSVMLILFSSFMRKITVSSSLIIPYSIIIIQFAIASNILLLSRILAKAVYNEWFSTKKNVKSVMIFGAGCLGQITRNVLIADSLEKINLLGFIDDNIFLQNKRIAGVPIYSFNDAFEKIIPQNNVTELILASDEVKFPLKLKRDIIDRCLTKKIVVKEVPSMSTWMNGKLNVGEIKIIKIEDLLGRDVLTLDRGKIKAGVKDAVILIAGAAGSIGSEIVNQLMAFNAYRVILLDKAESDLYDLQNEITRKYTNSDFSVIVGDVTNVKTLRRVFEKYMPTIVINAAAYKHVPLMEEFPNEAIRVNVGGTRNLANLSIEYGVEKFVFISTDKAVNPTNIMGTSKRISEIYVQSLAQKKSTSTQFITTRFGNVLGSNGSVVPLFKKQIENGGPVTVTHRDITRFFMTIPEACLLVLEACFMGKGGEIFIFDMGDPVKIYDLAEKMIFLSGFIPHEDIKIAITHLRPGEKLFEELLKSQEDLLPTYNDKILIGKVMKHDYYKVNNQIAYLLNSVDEWDNQYLAEYMKRMVPEFVSKNSYYNNYPLRLVADSPVLA